MSKRSKKRMGRPPKGEEARTILVGMKVSARELAEFKAAAKAAGMSLSSWLLLPRRQERESQQKGSE